MKKKRIFLGGCFGTGSVILAMIVYGIMIEPNQVKINHVWIRDGSLEKILGGKVVVQLSDLHIRKIGKREQKVLEIMNALRPDLVLLTGDYVTWGGDHAAALSFLARLKANIGVWAVMGDYDYSRSRKSCIFCHEEGSGKPTRQHSVRFLKDSMDLVSLPEGSLCIAGVDGEGDYFFSSDKSFAHLEGKIPTIILSHNPLNFDLIKDDRNLLMLAGDTHGGQVPLPNWLFSIMGYKKNALYSQGLFEKGQKKMFVSHGIGTSHLPIRFFRPPEVVVFHFKSE
jgi:predicted MPP superfamily phosphohydrolase